MPVMKKHRLSIFLTIALALAGSGTECASLTASKAFADAPREVFPLLTEMTRLDMIDYFASGARTASRNVLDGESRIEEMTPAVLKVSMSDVSDYELAILPAKGDTIIALIATVMTPVPDSRLTFYTDGWEISEKPRFTEPTLREWLLPSAKGIIDDIENAIPFVPATYRIDTASQELTITNNLKELLPEADYNLVKNHVKPSLRYKWNGSRMVLKKD